MHARRSFLHWLRRCVWALAAMAALAPAVIAGQAAVRASAAPASVSAVEGKARTILDQALTARNPDTRKAAVQALGLIGPREPYLERLGHWLAHIDIVKFSDADLAWLLPGVPARSAFRTPQFVALVVGVVLFGMITLAWAASWARMVTWVGAQVVPLPPWTTA